MLINEIRRDDLTPALLALMAGGVPVEIRRTAVLTGQLPGRIMTDYVHKPTWLAIWEAGDGTLYWSGRPTRTLLDNVVTLLRQEGEVLIPFWTRDDPITSLLPADPDADAAALDFLVRDLGVDLNQYVNHLPAGIEIVPADLTLFRRTYWYEDNIRLSGSEEAYLANARAYYLLKGDEICCEASAGPLVDGVRELGVRTYEQVRGRGYATMSCAFLIREMEKAGERPFWNCSARNLASAAVARKLGLGGERRFEFAWYQMFATGD